jgi:signal transduction histidine kinase
VIYNNHFPSGGSIISTRNRLSMLTTLLVAALTLLGASGASAATGMRVLALYSYNRLVPGNIEFDQGLGTVLTGTGAGSPRLFSEFLDTPEFHGNDYENLMATYLRGKYAKSPPDVIVAVADNALEFAVRHRADLFPGIPIVYALVPPSELQALSPLPSDVVGVPGDYDFTGTIAQALLWHPKATRLVIITGASVYDRRRETRLRREVPAILRGVTAEYWSALSMPVLQTRLAALGTDTVVFTTGFFQDGDGNQFVPRDAVALMVPASSAPVYSPFDTSMGTGVVGGRVLNLAESGQEVGRVVKDLLAGVAPSALRLPQNTPTILHIDWRQVQRWGIDEKAIPADAVVYFRDPAIWQAHRAAVLIAVSVFLVQMALISALYLERRRRSAAESTTQTLNTQLAHASRLAVAGELTASIAHEINQPLGAIQTSADAADMLLQSGTEHREDLIRIVTRIRRDNLRASEVIRRLRTLLARHEPERILFDVGLAMTDVAVIMRPEAERRKITLNVQSAFSPGFIAGDRTQIQQVLINLVLNAMDAVADLPESRRVVELSMERDGSKILIAVRDRGGGISPENLPKLFDSFFTTKQRGMGLGLAIARSIVEGHGGSIWAENREPYGAAFNVELPIAETQSAKPQADA